MQSLLVDLSILRPVKKGDNALPGPTRWNLRLHGSNRRHHPRRSCTYLFSTEPVQDAGSTAHGHTYRLLCGVALHGTITENSGDLLLLGPLGCIQEDHVAPLFIESDAKLEDSV